MVTSRLVNQISTQSDTKKLPIANSKTTTNKVTSYKCCEANRSLHNKVLICQHFYWTVHHLATQKQENIVSLLKFNGWLRVQTTALAMHCLVASWSEFIMRIQIIMHGQFSTWLQNHDANTCLWLDNWFDYIVRDNFNSYLEVYDLVIINLNARVICMRAEFCYCKHLDNHWKGVTKMRHKNYLKL